MKVDEKKLKAISFVYLKKKDAEASLLYWFR